MTNAEANKRLFVGNLLPDVASGDLERLFGRYGRVTNVEIKNKTDIDGKITSTFAFISADMTEESLPECIQTLNGLKWKKQNLKVQAAQESFMQRLQRERQERIQKFANQQEQTHPKQVPQREQQQQHQQRTLKHDEKNPNYDPMSMFKRVMKNEEPSAKKPSTGSKKEDKSKGLIDQESMFFQCYKEKVDETVPGVGKAKNGLVTFSDDDVDDKDQRDRNEGRPSKVKLKDKPRGMMSNSKRKYHSSSEDDDTEEDTAAQSVPMIPKNVHKKVEKPSQVSKPKPKPLARKRYYSNSDEESENENESKVPTNQGLRFGGDFWGDSDDEQTNHSKRPSKKSFEQNFSKRPNVEDANAKRLQSIKQRQKELQRTQKTLGKIQVDGPIQSKKIIFDHKDIKHESKSKLFQESDESDDEDHFKVKEQFEGKSGEKLLELQSKIAATDDRFKVDSRFKESDSSSSSSSDESESERKIVKNQGDIQSEKPRNLALSQSVIGDKKNTAVKKERRAVEFKDTSRLRFDPDDESHAKKFEKGQDSDSDTSETSQVEPPPPTETPMPEMTNDKSYFLKKDTFSKKEPKSGFSFGFKVGETGQSQGFSLLKKFGREPYEAEEVSKKDKKGKLGFLERNPFKYDSSSEDDEVEDEKPSSEHQSSQSKPALPSQEDQMAEFSRKLAQKSISVSTKLSEAFLFKVNDPRFIEGAEFLSHDKESLDETREKYEEQRPILAKIIKKKRRNRVQKQNQMTMKAKKNRKSAWQQKKLKKE
ncbi:nucleolar protein 8-like [Tigriopus californicus]|uniref:nucleolar protein 8-like n=1 Tax=Tigriopus californicus TaxID=6832 RepID=UPI0027DA7CF0|nr:nucleolar protein 8-like [Tigriopus californicus]